MGDILCISNSNKTLYFACDIPYYFETISRVYLIGPKCVRSLTDFNNRAEYRKTLKYLVTMSQKWVTGLITLPTQS